MTHLFEDSQNDDQAQSSPSPRHLNIHEAHCWPYHDISIIKINNLHLAYLRHRPVGLRQLVRFWLIPIWMFAYFFIQKKFADVLFCLNMISLDFPGASFIAFVLKNTTNSALVHFLLLKYDPKFISQHMTFMPCRTLPILLFVNKIEDLLVLFIRD